MKPTRIVDEELLDAVRRLPCLACASEASEASVRHALDYSGEVLSHPHHVRSRGAGGGDVPNNVMPLCHKHHAEIHARGKLDMASKYPVVRFWLETAGHIEPPPY